MFQSDMLRSLKRFSCPSCSCAYTSRDMSRVSKFPLILNCGHTLCEWCLKTRLKSSRKLTCTICQESSEYSDDDVSKLLPDVYALGLLCANIKLPNLKIRFVPEVVKKKSEEVSVQCDMEQCQKEASFRCEKCEENFCNTCFDSFHKKQGKKFLKHVGTPVYSHPYSTVVQSGCPEHDSRTIEFYCNDDEQLICSLCVVTGIHKSHSVITLETKNISCTEDLRLSREHALQTQRRLKYTEQKISELVPSQKKIESSHWIQEIHEHFHDLHTALLKRENEMISEILTVSQSNVHVLEKLRQEVSDSCKDLGAMLRDAENAIENPSLPISVPALLEKLDEHESIPCHLVSSASTVHLDAKSINLEFDSELKSACMKHGLVNCASEDKFSLRSDKDLPEGYVVDPLPPELFQADVEISDTMSECSMSSNVNSNADMREKLRILPMKVDHFLASKHEKVSVIHIRDPTHFYVMKCSDSGKLSTLLQKIGQWCKTTKADKEVPSKIVNGDLYLVNFTEDMRWYRARITKIIPLNKGAGDDESVILNGVNNINEIDVDPKDAEQQEVEVFYIDFGNAEKTTVSRLRNIQPEFLTMSGLAKRCSLFDIVPITGTWTLEAINAFMTFVTKKAVNMEILDERNNILYVDLSQAASSNIISDVPVSVRDALIFLEHGCFIASKSKKEKSRKNQRRFLASDNLRANTKCTVLVTHVDSPSSFYINQWASSRHLSDLILDMKNFYDSESNGDHSIYAPYKGMMCAAKYNKDDMWYRAEVISLPGAGNTEVKYVDFGNKEVLHHSRIRKLMDKYAKLSVQANECLLADVKEEPSGWSAEATQWFRNQVEKKKLTLLTLGMVPNKKVIKSVLYEVENDVEKCINAMMVEQNFATCGGVYGTKVHLLKRSPKPVSILKPPTSNYPRVLADKNYQMPLFPPCDPMPVNEPESLPEPAPIKAPEPMEESFKASVPKESPNRAEVIVSHIDSPGCFFIRIAGEIEQRYKRLANTLKQVYPEFDSHPEVINENESYAVFREVDDTWYRGYVTEKESDDVFQVRFVDVGFIERVESKHFRVLLQNHGVDETFAVKCHLAHIVPAGDSNRWSQFASDTFRDSVLSHPVLNLVAEGAIDNGSLPSDLHIRKFIQGGALEPSRVTFDSVRELLLDTGVALRKRPPHQSRSSPTSSSKSSNNSQLGSSTSLGTESEKVGDNGERALSAETIDAPLDVQIRALQLAPPQPRTPKFQWTKAPLPIKRQFKGKPTHVADDGCIYIQIVPETVPTVSKLELITKSLHVKYLDAPPEKLRIPPPIGEGVAAKFHIDQKWHRAEIVSDDPNKIKVVFVDFGNCEIVSLDDIRTNIMMDTIPCQAHECYLHDIRPANGTMYKTEVLDFLHTTIVDLVCNVDVKVEPIEGHPLQIELYLDDIIITKLLKELGNAVSVSEYEQQEEKEAKEEKSYSLPVTAYVISPMKLPSPMRVCVTNLLPHGLICLQCLRVEEPKTEVEKAHNAEVEKFLKMMEELSCKGENFPTVINPHKGLACCAKYSFDKNWYRCEVTSIDSKGVEVFYVDYGNSEVVSLERLREPEPKFLEYPSQLHVCKIRGVMLEKMHGWSKGAVQDLTSRLYDNSNDLYATVVSQGKIPEVDLLVKNSAGEMQLAYQDLIDKGLIKVFGKD